MFGQLVSVYQYATATLIVLGGSTVAAIGVGLVYGRGKRVWCRHLCPVNGVFAALSRLSPLHFAVDARAWTANACRIAVHPVNCAPMVRIRRMTGPTECHMCGRCSDLRGAIALAARPLRGRWPANAFALAYALTPLAGVGLFIGLTSLTATLAHGEGWRLTWLPMARALLLAFGGGWSLWLAHRQLGKRVTGLRRVLSLSGFAIAIAGCLGAWMQFVFR